LRYDWNNLKTAPLEIPKVKKLDGDNCVLICTTWFCQMVISISMPVLEAHHFNHPGFKRPFCIPVLKGFRRLPLSELVTLLPSSGFVWIRLRWVYYGQRRCKHKANSLRKKTISFRLEVNLNTYIRKQQRFMFIMFRRYTRLKFFWTLESPKLANEMQGGRVTACTSLTLPWCL
jgi:hypothetical protein